MKYIYRCTGEVVSEEDAREIACQNIELSDIANDYENDYDMLIIFLQELQRLCSPLLENIWEDTVGCYIEEYFEEVVEDGDDE